MTPINTVVTDAADGEEFADDGEISGPSNRFQNRDLTPISRSSTSTLELEKADSDIEVLDVDGDEIQVLKAKITPKKSQEGGGGDVKLNLIFELWEIREKDKVYGLETGLKDPWREASVENVKVIAGKVFLYLITTFFLRLQTMATLNFTGPKIKGRKAVDGKVVSEKHIAYFHASIIKPVPVGFRIIARTGDKTETGKFFFAGIVAETPSPTNNNRYLVFFDDGNAAYCDHEDIRIVPRANLVSKNTWSEVHPDTQLFIKEYIESWPENIFKATLRESAIVIVEWNGKWWPARVLKAQPTNSLVKLKLIPNEVQFVLWRGSQRLFQVYKHKHKQKYFNSADRALNSLSTTSRIPVEYEGKMQLCKIEDKYRTQTQQHVTDEQNDCTFECSSKFNGTNYERAKIMRRVSPLAYPLYCGWKREKFGESSSKRIYYETPCGKRLWNYGEIQKFISMTHCDFGIDSFCFDISVDCLAEFKPTVAPFYSAEDISGGTEWVQVSKVNQVDSSVPPYLHYAPNTRLPLDQNFINTQPEFLVCCDCTDNCEDRKKCACFCLTFENDPDFQKTSSAEFPRGYQNRRLFQTYSFGLYECNNGCKCKSTCNNRVVQNGLQWKLQVFNTGDKGYAIRTLQDIPLGSFICVYNGEIMCGSKATDIGSVAGDEYLANLDFIEEAEKFKEGYEACVAELASQSQSRTKSNRKRKRKDRNHRRATATAGANSNVNGGENPTEDRNGSGNSSAQNANASESSERYLNSNSNEDSSATRQLFGAEQDRDIYAIDAKSIGNVGRYINHSCHPNVFSQQIFIDTHDIRFPWVSFFASCFIKCGTELTWDYNYTEGMADGKFVVCNCGAVSCKKRLL